MISPSPPKPTGSKYQTELLTEADIYDLAMTLKREVQLATQRHFKDS
jgi:hypothetical protein